MTIIATITRQDGSTETEAFENERQARAFCIEECKWESTARVACPAIEFDQAGDYAATFTTEKAGDSLATSYTLTPEQVQAAIAGHDLRTYKGWMAAARAILADAPALTGITEGTNGQVVLKVDFDGNADVYAYWDNKKDGIYYEEYLSDFDSSAWDDDAQSWDGVDMAVNIAVLTNPTFIGLRHD